jgi:hypothetical protein
MESLILYEEEAVTEFIVGVGVACGEVHYKTEKGKDYNENKEKRIVAALDADNVGGLDKVVFV